MMLITLEQFAEVPAKIHLFYEYAFEALFGRHDATKGGGFQRKRYTALPLDDFKRLFSYFCAITYMKQMTTFSKGKALELIQQSITASQISTDKTGFQRDVAESTSMLILDGLDYTFSHRSFQEYFAAYFFSRVKVDQFLQAIPLILRRGLFDNVFEMLSEMNNERFEEFWAAPVLDAMCKRLEAVEERSGCIATGRALLGEGPTLDFRTMRNRFAGGDKLLPMAFSETQRAQGEERIALYGHYELFEKIHSRLAKMKFSDEAVLKKIQDGTLLASDSRFDQIRNHSVRALRGMKDVRPIPLTDEDGKWLSETYFAKFMQIERELLPKLRDEVNSRVTKRLRGVEEIFASH